MANNSRKLMIDDYIVTEQGEVINKLTKKALKGIPNGKGYPRVSIGQRKYFIHRLVAEKYIPNPDNKPQINHINGDKFDNRVENLEWVTNQENRDHAVKERLHLSGEQCSWSRLTQEDVNYIRKHDELSAKELAHRFNVTAVHIRDIRNGKRWKL